MYATVNETATCNVRVAVVNSRVARSQLYRMDSDYQYIMHVSYVATPMHVRSHNTKKAVKYRVNSASF